MSLPRAAVDVGSNSVRLLVVGADGVRITRELTVTRLAAGVDRTGKLDDAALERTLDTIARYREIWLAHGVGRVRIAATSAVRDAADRERFFAGVRQVAGVDLDVLTGEAEAALSFAGAVRAVPVDEPAAVVDVGGGSTELIVGGADGAVHASVSLQLGCVRLAERHLHHDPPRRRELEAGEQLVREQLELAEVTLQDQGASLRDAATLVGVAGTATTLGALHAGLDSYREEWIHGTRIPAAALDTLAGALVAMSSAQRAGLGPMQPGRADVIHAGALVLAGVVRRFGFSEVVVSEADSLDGLVASLECAPR